VVFDGGISKTDQFIQSPSEKKSLKSESPPKLKKNDENRLVRMSGDIKSFHSKTRERNAMLRQTWYRLVQNEKAYYLL